jgi:hypothetical protein
MYEGSGPGAPCLDSETWETTNFNNAGSRCPNVSILRRGRPQTSIAEGAGAFMPLKACSVILSGAAWGPTNDLSFEG